MLATVLRETPSFIVRMIFINVEIFQQIGNQVYKENAYFSKLDKYGVKSFISYGMLALMYRR